MGLCGIDKDGNLLPPRWISSPLYVVAKTRDAQCSRALTTKKMDCLHCLEHLVTEQKNPALRGVVVDGLTGTALELEAFDAERCLVAVYHQKNRYDFDD